MLSTTNSNAEYQEFIQAKHPDVLCRGIDVDASVMAPVLKPFQRDLVAWALRKGRAALFADTGLGKTLMQLEWAKHIPGDVLILAPLAVAQQTVNMGRDLHIADVTLCRTGNDVQPGINITNYERLHLFDTDRFVGVVLDESSILKSYMGKTKQALIREFRNTDYKLCCTATPAPNDLMELGNHADFLGVMPSNEMLARWFINDTMHAGNYRLKKHAAEDYWRWVSSWAMAVSLPSDLGFEDEGFLLPPLNIQTLTVDTPLLPPPPGMLFDVSTPNATTLHRQKRHSVDDRSRAIADLVNASEDFWIVWCDTNYEADVLARLIPDAVEVRGSESPEAKESKLISFSEGQKRVIISKPSLAGHGLNWQHCHNVAFVGLSYSFEQFYQAVRRAWRYGQTETVNVYIATTEYEQSIDGVVWSKSAQFEAMKASMVDAVRELQMEELYGRRTRTHAPSPTSQQGDGWQLWLGDSVQVLREMDSESVDFSIFSPPFSGLYIYTDSLADMGNSADNEEFAAHFKYMLPDLLRVTVPGRLCAVHCKDLPAYMGRDGAAGLQDFPGLLIRAFEETGWQYHSRITIWKDPVTEMQRTKNHGLLHKQLCKDSAASRQGMADYLLVFRRWNETGEFPKPVNIGNERHRFEPGDYIGESPPDQFGSIRDYSIQVWQRYASPVWWDINQMRVLNYRQAKESKDERHICPLQLDVIDRAVQLWTNPGDLVLDPFSGIGSAGHEAILLGRRFVGIELKESYYNTAVKNLQHAVDSVNAKRLL